MLNNSRLMWPFFRVVILILLAIVIPVAIVLAIPVQVIFGFSEYWHFIVYLALLSLALTAIVLLPLRKSPKSAPDLTVQYDHRRSGDPLGRFLDGIQKFDDTHWKYIRKRWYIDDINLWDQVKSMIRKGAALRKLEKVLNNDPSRAQKTFHAVREALQISSFGDRDHVIKFAVMGIVNRDILSEEDLQYLYHPFRNLIPMKQHE